MRELKTPRAWFLLLLPLFLLLARYSLSTFSATREKRRHQQVADDHLPPSPPALPVLGHLHLVGLLPHISLRSLARKHGMDLMLLRLGSMPVLIVSSPRAAEEVLRTHDHVFASRPHSLVAEIVLYGLSDVGFAPYGDYWRQARKLVTTHHAPAQRQEGAVVRMVMARIGEAAAAGVAVDMSDLLGSFINALGCRAVMGKSFRSEGRDKLLRELIEDTSPLLGGFNVEEFFPFLARFGVLSKVVRAKSVRLRRRWDELLDRLIEEHESKYAAVASGDSPKDDDDFIHVLLSVRQEYGLNREHMKAILLDVFFAGIGTASSMLDFTMAELMRKPHMMEKLQAEVNSSVPQGLELLSETNLTGMDYLRAVIKESLRLHPVAPLLPHFSMAGCSIDGHTIPAGLQVLINTWAIGRDARCWEDAEEFIPERFIGDGSAAHVNFKGNDFQFLPFGSGRRMCAGVNFGIACIELMLANLVHRFDWELPVG
ncbi:unnamed protein product [Urochloa decumbens]|uniref:Indole-2-monooxygenase n=1 Tax=Urochloa decumbens TaxID=240449 RepID=A0ABC9F4I8_9POAL